MLALLKKWQLLDYCHHPFHASGLYVLVLVLKRHANHLRQTDRQTDNELRSVLHYDIKLNNTTYVSDYYYYYFYYGKKETLVKATVGADKSHTSVRHNNGIRRETTSDDMR